MNKKEILKINEVSKIGKDKFKISGIKRLYTEQQVLDKLAKLSGFQSYKQYRSIERTKKYKVFKRYSENVLRKTHLGSRFAKTYAKAYKKNFKRRSKELDDLLRYVSKRNIKTPWEAGETPK